MVKEESVVGLGRSLSPSFWSFTRTGSGSGSGTGHRHRHSMAQQTTPLDVSIYVAGKSHRLV